MEIGGFRDLENEDSRKTSLDVKDGQILAPIT